MVIIWNVTGFWKFFKGKPTASLPWRFRDRSVVSNFPPAGHTLRSFLAWSEQVRIISILNRLIFFLLVHIYPLAYLTTNQSFRSGRSRRSERYESDDGLQTFQFILGRCCHQRWRRMRRPSYQHSSLTNLPSELLPGVEVNLSTSGWLTVCDWLTWLTKQECTAAQLSGQRPPYPTPHVWRWEKPFLQF